MLKDQGYHVKVDNWSIGVMLYLLITGKKDKEEEGGGEGGE